MNQIKCCEYAPLCCIHNAPFYSQLTKRPNELECLSLANLSGLVQSNTVAYGAYY
jgi:hypothetical protein